jgi:GT2 family glycosyltransferase
VVDNASTDRSVEMITQSFHEVKVIANTKNEGMARAYNQGLEAG